MQSSLLNSTAILRVPSLLTSLHDYLRAFGAWRACVARRLQACGFNCTTVQMSCPSFAPCCRSTTSFWTYDPAVFSSMDLTVSVAGDVPLRLHA